MTEQRITVKVIAGSRRNCVVEEESRWKVYVTAVREKGAANDAVIAVLSEHLNVSPRCVRIIRGVRSSIKIIAIVR